MSDIDIEEISQQLYSQLSRLIRGINKALEQDDYWDDPTLSNHVDRLMKLYNRLLGYEKEIRTQRTDVAKRAAEHQDRRSMVAAITDKLAGFQAGKRTD